MSCKVRGLNSGAKQRAVRDLVDAERANIVMLQETKLTRRLSIAGFHCTQTQMQRKGGCLTAANFKGSRSVKTLNRTISWSSIRLRGTPIHLLNVYVDPGDQDVAKRTMQNLGGIVQSLHDRTNTPRIVIAGDFN